jgi:hypothetical protein
MNMAVRNNDGFVKNGRIVYSYIGFGLVKNILGIEVRR